jgi:hypothetical protein
VTEVCYDGSSSRTAPEERDVAEFIAVRFRPEFQQERAVRFHPECR